MDGKRKQNEIHIQAEKEGSQAPYNANIAPTAHGRAG